MLKHAKHPLLSFTYIAVVIIGKGEGKMPVNSMNGVNLCCCKCVVCTVYTRTNIS